MKDTGKIINEIENRLKERRKEKLNIFFKTIFEAILILMFSFSGFTATIFGLFLLPQVINFSPTLYQAAWMFCIGIFGWLFLPIFILLKLIGGKHAKTSRRKANRS